MSKNSKSSKTALMADEYDFRRGVPGKYARRYSQGTNVVLLDADVAEVFYSSGQVNEALRGLARLARRQTELAEK